MEISEGNICLVNMNAEGKRSQLSEGVVNNRLFLFLNIQVNRVLIL